VAVTLGSGIFVAAGGIVSRASPPAASFFVYHGATTGVRLKFRGLYRCGAMHLCC
jgi:hypothetical protein